MFVWISGFGGLGLYVVVTSGFVLGSPDGYGKHIDPLPGLKDKLSLMDVMLV